MHLNQLPVLLLLTSFCHPSSGMQSNGSCAPMPTDKRQLVCLCGRQLQLKCVFNSDIKQLGVQHLDRTLRPVRPTEVSLSRLVNPYDEFDDNMIFQNGQRMRAAANENTVYSYFPDFSLFSAPYIRITFQRFQFVPSFAFIDTSLVKNVEFRKISSIVFEMNNAYDFGVDKYAFYGVKSESLLIEGKAILY